MTSQGARSGSDGKLPAEVLVEHPAEGIALVRLNAPERRHALTGDMARQLVAAILEADRNPSIGAVVVAGTADGFCAGAKRELLDAVGAQEPAALTDITDVYRVFEVMRRAEVPIIAAVRGPAVGAGLNIVLAADVRVVAEDAFLRSMFLANEIHPGGGHLHMLHNIAGPELTTLMAVLDEPVRGAEFARLGGAAYAVAAEEVESRALALAKRVGRQPALGRTIKATVGATVLLTAQEAATCEADRQSRTLQARSRLH